MKAREDHTNGKDVVFNAKKNPVWRERKPCRGVRNQRVILHISEHNGHPLNLPFSKASYDGIEIGFFLKGLHCILVRLSVA